MASTFPAPFGDEIIGIAKAAQMPLGTAIVCIIPRRDNIKVNKKFGW